MGFSPNPISLSLSLAVALPLPLILSPYNQRLIARKKRIIYRDERGLDLDNDRTDSE